MGIIIILFFIAIILAFIMISYQAWEIKTLRVEKNNNPAKIMPEMYFRHVEKIILYLTKNIIQWIILITVKYWYISCAKIKKWGNKNWPKVSNFFKNRIENLDYKKNTFIKRAVLESKIKIKRIKEKVKRENEEINTDN